LVLLRIVWDNSLSEARCPNS